AIRLVNAIGQQVYKNVITTLGDELFEIPVHRLPAGIYWLHIEGEQGSKVIKQVLVLQR
ncbi:MAG: T9SS type A sorting domain-containing protein, partial [Flavisolibacter sp.]|nr:T9SS type A sorting domain-containing protein [Flavisolibacter sp.]